MWKTNLCSSENKIMVKICFHELDYIESIKNVEKTFWQSSVTMRRAVFTV